MSNISSVRLPNGTTYNIKDNTAVKTVELTQAEYDALSQAEKENGDMYLISDGEPEYTIINDSVPIGAIQAYGGIMLPYGWLFCDGTAISRESYSELFSVIGTTYGEGDGSTTFNLPDLRGRVSIGVGTNYTLGSSGGNENHDHLYAFQFGGYYQDTIMEQDANAGVINYRTNAPVQGVSIGDYAVVGNSGITTATKEVSAAHYKSEGYSGSTSTMQPYTVTNYIIKARNTISSSVLEELDPQSIIFDMFYPIGSYYETSDSTFNPNVQWRGTWVQDSKGRVLVAQDPDQTEFDTVGETGGEKTNTLTLDEAPAHTHGRGTMNITGSFYPGHGKSCWIEVANVSGAFYPSATESNCGVLSFSSVAGGNTCINFDASRNWSGSTESKGGGKPHNNLQPYTVAYRWHRIA